MTFKEYQKYAESTAVYPKDEGIKYTALGLCGESGEVAEKVKKFIRDGKFDAEEIKKELGDVLWYVAMSAKELGSDIEEIASINVNKLLKRKLENKIKGEGDNR